ncbi:MAG: hypothetical protein JXA60_12840 [Candidatus Coatesbacteria bacterium]|nr:hypothetical protein [Candidatus Coatesbacteria bacterium]
MEKIHYLIILTLLLFSCSGSMAKEEKKENIDKKEIQRKDEKKENDKPELVKKISDFTLKSEISVYNEDNLFDLINGGAEIYIQNGLKKAYAFNYEGNNNKEVEVHIYFFNKADGASMIYKLKEKDLPGSNATVKNNKSTCYVALAEKSVFVLTSVTDAEVKGNELEMLASSIAKKLGIEIKKKIIQYK